MSYMVTSCTPCVKSKGAKGGIWPILASLMNRGYNERGKVKKTKIPTAGENRNVSLEASRET